MINSKTNKVVENLGIDGQYMSKETYEEYLLYTKEKQFDRKQSMEHFKDD